MTTHSPLQIGKRITMRLYTIEQTLGRVGNDKALQDIAKTYNLSDNILKIIARHIHRILKDNGYKIVPIKEDSWDRATNDHTKAQLTGQPCLCPKCFR